MATVNNLVVLFSCQCGNISERIVEFRFGHLRQLTYYIGSAIRWAHPSLGSQSDEIVFVQGWLQACQECLDEGDIGVVIRAGKIVGLTAWKDIEKVRTEHIKQYWYED